jgi:hypothetical protein
MVAIPHALEAKVIYPSCTIFEKAVAVEGYTRHVIGNYPMYGGTPRLYNAIGSCGDHGEQILIDHDRLSENLNIFGSYFEKRSSKEFTWNVYEHPAATEVNEPCDPPVKVNLNDEAQIKRLLAADIRLRRLDGTCYSTKTPPYFDPN